MNNVNKWKSDKHFSFYEWRLQYTTIYFELIYRGASVVSSACVRNSSLRPIYCVYIQSGPTKMTQLAFFLHLGLEAKIDGSNLFLRGTQFRPIFQPMLSTFTFHNPKTLWHSQWKMGFNVSHVWWIMLVKMFSH